MNIQQNVSLANYSTMGLGGQAAYLTDITSKGQVAEAVKWSRDQDLSFIMIGGGSNIVWRDEGFAGLVLVNKIAGFDMAENETGTTLTIGAGENWDLTVERSVEAGLTGIEALSLIPGTAGGTPVQNVGAYGQEIAETLVSVEAYDTETGRMITVPAAECQFSYRDSRFKSGDRGRFLITGLTLRLARGAPKPPFYGSVQAYFEENSIADPSPADLRAAVVHIRSNKLPDPAKVPNTGSFFGNPIISPQYFEKLKAEYPDIPSWPSGKNVKLSAAWLIEQAGFKDYHDKQTGMATWPTQPLVLINENAASTADLLEFKQKILETIKEKFGINLIQEPELLP